eukprot:TRINITY_DN8065_c0_g2_i7.p1 TRINITY_DN8065_c0_g2~~TRINITY_DN8065_c0_g2_i7.p1  ORF type:complete len:282 (-),score=25.60 TRINITY_DN8065_c0_g2_i7:1647-2444(-)
MVRYCCMLHFLGLIILAACQLDGQSSQTDIDQNGNSSIFQTVPNSVRAYGDYASGGQSTSVFAGTPPQNNTNSDEIFASDITPLADNQNTEPVAVYTGDYQDGENLGAFLLDMQTDTDNLNASSIETFLLLINDTEVLDDICTLGGVTVFAPSEQAFDQFVQGESILKQDLVRFTSNRKKMLKILQTHVAKAQIQDLIDQNSYLTLNNGILVEIFVEGSEPQYGIKTKRNSAFVKGTIFRAINCKEFNVAAVVVDNVLIPENVAQ